ncbi:MAG: type IX secretion system membrane protein PorP/SprF [Flavobacteriales bacterium]|nr:MAG: type IX secretion system membrane protein PorP/SprF [Flavobacteriales bacterium]MBE7443277.1 type IX secretion system membrane protein PorP/SprF [Flavobacteriales bacterium]MBX2958906.1 type IX secretion system membrane protein PorP/SprF [Flavobacteriales bacterium]MCL4856033.1 type IX secretion system membrane protein PorP/SprF [Flavobacteriales bacterium]
MKKILLILTLLTALEGFAQQDPQYSLYMFNPLGVNPGYAGSREALSGVLVHRSQWVGLEGAPVTQAFSVNSPLKIRSMGVGLNVTNDKIGPKNIITATAVYAYRIKVGAGKLAFGLRGGIQNYNYNWSMIEYKDKEDQIPNTAVGSFVIPTFDFGLYYNTNTFYAGIALEHLNEAQFSFTKAMVETNNGAQVYSHVTGTIGKAFVINNELVLKTSALIRSDRQGNGNIDVNGSILINRTLQFGLTLNTRKSIIILAEYNISKVLRIGYAYDHNYSDLTKTTGSGSHEIFVGYDFNLSKTRVTSPRYF